MELKRRIIFREEDLSELKNHLLRGPDEEAAVCLGGHVMTNELTAILVREVHAVPAEMLISQSGAFVEIDPVWLAGIIKRARLAGLSVVIAHSHPFSRQSVSFSSIDRSGQDKLIPKLQGRVPAVPHAEIVMGQESIDALMWLPEDSNPRTVDVVRGLGTRIDDVTTTSATPRSDEAVLPEDSRQILFLSAPSQQRMADLKVGVIGASGNGGPICMELVHLGVGSIVAVDPDSVESTNRNRVPNSRPSDDGITAKVEIVRRYASEVRPTTTVTPIKEPVEEAWQELRDCDVIFGCTDNASSRFVLNRLATQYFIPLIDTGVEIEVVEGQVRTIAGRVNVIRPGDKCLESLGITNEVAAKQELMNSRRPGYLDEDPAASAMPANMMVAGIAGIEFLKLVHGVLGGSPRDRYLAFGRSGEVRACESSGPECEGCYGLAGFGDAGPSPDAALQGAELDEKSRAG